MPAYRVNELIACHWISKEVEIEKAQDSGKSSISVIEKLEKIRNRPKPKFKF
jgi:hypothetical protein